jgi:hypothetical protein
MTQSGHSLHEEGFDYPEVDILLRELRDDQIDEGRCHSGTVGSSVGRSTPPCALHKKFIILLCPADIAVGRNPFNGTTPIRKGI